MSNVKAESPVLDAFESAVAASLAAAADKRASSTSSPTLRRKWTEANVITSPAWMLEGRTFAAATGAACGSPQFVTRDIRPPPDDGYSASKRRVMLAGLAPQPHPRRCSLYAISFRFDCTSIARIFRRPGAERAERAREHALLRHQRRLGQGRRPGRPHGRRRALSVARRRGRSGRAHLARLSEHADHRRGAGR